MKYPNGSRVKDTKTGELLAIKNPSGYWYWYGHDTDRVISPYENGHLTLTDDHISKMFTMCGEIAELIEPEEAPK